MPEIDSPHWDWILGVCKKHGLPQVPCPECMATRDSDIEVTISSKEKEILENMQAFAAINEEPIPTVKDLLPADQADWLATRVVS